ncbi:4070_t:CDS:2 [Gigaspora rosea]|nr:4070_t:CDS:2 [Gigaspora rosea]
MKQEESPTEIKEKTEIFERVNVKFTEKIWKPKFDTREEDTKEVENNKITSSTYVPRLKFANIGCWTMSTKQCSTFKHLIG